MTSSSHPQSDAFPPEASSQSYAQSLDTHDPLRKFRSEFILPSKADLKRKTLSKAPSTNAATSSTSQSSDAKGDEECIYLCGNSLGLQPRRTAPLINEYLTSWSTKAVTGHFVGHDDSVLPPYLHVDDYAAELMAPLVGAGTEEVVTMGTLTGNLHLLMASFYRPDAPSQGQGKAEGRHKILLEGKAFPSDHFAVESQIRHFDHDPSVSMITLGPPDPSSSPCLTTSSILSAIDTHADTTALLLLPGIQFYTGQLFDIKTITAYAHSKGIPSVGWDLAHAVGNVELKLHDWDVDFAVWCNYKYVNAGPGCIAGAFVHERHGRVDERGGYRHRLAGWWGADKGSRFEMDNRFTPRPGAPGYQLSNPSALDLTSLIASLQIFNTTSMSALRAKSLKLTAYLEHLLDTLPIQTSAAEPLYQIITPRTPHERGAQLSVKLTDQRLLPIENVLTRLESGGVVVDERKPDVIRVAPAPLYNSYGDVWRFAQVFSGALEACLHGGGGGGGGGSKAGIGQDAGEEGAIHKDGVRPAEGEGLGRQQGA